MQSDQVPTCKVHLISMQQRRQAHGGRAARRLGAAQAPLVVLLDLQTLRYAHVRDSMWHAAAGCCVVASQPRWELLRLNCRRAAIQDDRPSQVRHKHRFGGTTAATWSPASFARPPRFRQAAGQHTITRPCAQQSPGMQPPLRALPAPGKPPASPPPAPTWRPARPAGT